MAGQAIAPPVAQAPSQGSDDEQPLPLTVFGRAGCGYADGMVAGGDHRRVEAADPPARGGCLLEGRVWPTLEVVNREAPAELRKTPRPGVGLALTGPDRS
jgi:hypothetical protein